MYVRLTQAQATGRCALTSCQSLSLAAHSRLSQGPLSGWTSAASVATDSASDHVVSRAPLLQRGSRVRVQVTRSICMLVHITAACTPTTMHTYTHALRRTPHCPVIHMRRAGTHISGGVELNVVSSLVSAAASKAVRGLLWPRSVRIVDLSHHTRRHIASGCAHSMHCRHALPIRCTEAHHSHSCTGSHEPGACRVALCVDRGVDRRAHQVGGGRRPGGGGRHAWGGVGCHASYPGAVGGASASGSGGGACAN